MESHMIHITQRAHMSLTGLEKVISMEPELVEVETTADHLAIKGQNLHAEKLERYRGCFIRTKRERRKPRRSPNGCFDN